MADASDAASAATSVASLFGSDGASMWAGLMPFIQQALKFTNQPSQAQQLAQQMIAHPPSHGGGKHAASKDAVVPFGANGLVGGPLGAQVPGPMSNEQVQGPLATPMPAVPYAAPASAATAPPPAIGGGGGLFQMPTAPIATMGMPSINSTSALTSNPFETGMPNMFGAR